MVKRLTTEEFIERSKAVHGDRFCYSKVKYVNQYAKVLIICSEHGEYWQEPRHHMTGSCCPKCSGGVRFTQDYFLELAVRKHGNKYDYDKVEYVDIKTKVLIVCPKHGDFTQDPDSHIKGVGCPKCGREKTANALRSSTKEFIEHAKKVHGDKYNYDKVEYIGNHEKVIITCLKHKDFPQAPSGHLGGYGCPKCANEYTANLQRSSAEEFIKKAKKIHGNEYNYDKVEYVTTHSDVIITCIEHGDFPQAPSGHLSGHGCPVCSGNLKLTTEEFITKAMDKHGNKYNYKKVEYINAKSKVIIICDDHNEFLQMPDHHVRGEGCPTCGFNKRVATRTKSQDLFLEQIKKIHEKRYDYSKVKYNGAFKKIIIICPEHGEFKQGASDHLCGRGCPKCADEIRQLGDTLINLIKSGRYIEGSLYVIQIFSSNENFFKIGLTTKTIERRFHSEKNMPYDFEIILDVPIGAIEAYQNEQRVLDKLYKHSYKPHIHFGGETECLSVNPIEHDPYLQDLAERYSIET